MAQLSSTVTVRVDSAAGRVQLVVSDDGPGMTADVASHAFDRFVRGDSPRATSRGSSGLGLPIVAAIVAAHGGAVRLDSSSQGTTVTVDLPRGERS